MPRGTSRLRRLQTRALARGETFDIDAYLAANPGNPQAIQRITDGAERRLDKRLKQFTGDGACRRCHATEAVVSFLPQADKPVFCEPCGTAALAGWHEFLEPGHRAKTFSRYRRLYGIGVAEYGLLYEVQGGLCLICRAIDRPLVVDHCHDTGHVRGLLCAQCNSALGLLRDDPQVMKRAAAYLRLTQTRLRRNGETQVEALRRLHTLGGLTS